MFHLQVGVDIVGVLSLAVYLVVLGDKGYIMAGWLKELILHCIAWLAWMVYPDLALSVWCDGAVNGIVARSKRGGSG
jgi:hypothetical protein